MAFGFGIIAKFVEDKIADYGTSVIMGVVASSPIGAGFAAASKFSEFVESGGMSEIDSLTQDLIKTPNFRFKGMDLLQKLQASVTNPVRIPNWQRRAPWAKSRRDWLDNAWKHDWRSQPRNKIGEWIPGRLLYPDEKAPAIGKGRQRTSKQRRRINRYRRYGRLAARSIKYDA